MIFLRGPQKPCSPFSPSSLFHCESTYFSAPLSAPKTYLTGVQHNRTNQIPKVPHSTPPSSIKDLRAPARCTWSVSSCVHPHSLYTLTMDTIGSWSFFGRCTTWSKLIYIFLNLSISFLTPISFLTLPGNDLNPVGWVSSLQLSPVYHWKLACL